MAEPMTKRQILDLIDEARDSYNDFQLKWRAVGMELRRDPGNIWNRIDAYPGWDGKRDVGAGQSMEEWMDEVQSELDEERCDRCGLYLEFTDERAEIIDPKDPEDAPLIIHQKCFDSEKGDVIA